MEDVARLDERVRKLQTHFAQAGKDIEGIVVSARKVTARGGAIQAVEVDDGEAPQAAPAAPRRRAGPKRPDLPELPFADAGEV